MLSYMPTILLPPLVPPPSISSRINILLDNMQNLFKQHRFEEARDNLFTAYALFETDDALMDYYKVYFHTMNGLLLIKMLEYNDYNAEQVEPYNLAKLAILALTDAIDVSQKLVTCDRAFPRFFLGFLFFKLKKYETALRFFREAEALAISAEGSESVFAAMAQFDIAIVGYKLLLHKIYSACGIDRFDHEKAYSSIVENEEEEQEYELHIVDCENVAQMERIGQNGLEDLELLVKDWSDVIKPEDQHHIEDEDVNARSQESFYTLSDEFLRLKLLFEHSVGTAHFYTSEAAVAWHACSESAEAMGYFLNPSTEHHVGILEQIHEHKDPLSQALLEYERKFQKIPARALHVPIKKTKSKGKK